MKNILLALSGTIKRTRSILWQLSISLRPGLTRESSLPACTTNAVEKAQILHSSGSDYSAAGGMQIRGLRLDRAESFVGPEGP